MGYQGEQHDNINFLDYQKYKKGYNQLQTIMQLFKDTGATFNTPEDLIEILEFDKLQGATFMPDFQGGGNTTDNAAGSGPETIPTSDTSGSANPAPDPLDPAGGNAPASTNNPA